MKEMRTLQSTVYFSFAYIPREWDVKVDTLAKAGHEISVSDFRVNIFVLFIISFDCYLPVQSNHIYDIYLFCCLCGCMRVWCRREMPTG